MTAIQITKLEECFESVETNRAAISLVQPIVIKVAPTMTEPAIMNGRRRPFISAFYYRNYTPS